MTEVEYRITDYWINPQLLDMHDVEWVIDPYSIKDDATRLCERGLNQIILANGYHCSIKNVIISRRER